MNKEEFKKYVIAEATKYLFSTENKAANNIQENAEEKVFRFKVKHDKGTTTLSAKASSQEEAKKKLMNAEGAPANAFTPINEGKLNPSEIKNLAEEIKKLNKKIDLRNPLISESDESFVETIINENKSTLREREVDVDGINKKKHIGFQNEGEKDKWNRMLGYNVPSDEERP